ncbi:MAG: hypothetical protein UX35_C0007G0029 [Microgenomates group bacterium GW2011_GWA1_46_15]|nr:MAG: hypothetical protein UX00_C0009G0041 [Microgenomates group bacterium GW2011_GWB1_45_17]KKU23291.1 MAG: hypothetical protein UX35_C0007G0029 [Microgenomates group bacterium GW2011_GWA1_46_15]KKU23460.1 MAG: hypothetical protein UX36_C0005G0041 [Microgenomates group bacterium GW2011_GWC1_46_15]
MPPVAEQIDSFCYTPGQGEGRPARFEIVVANGEGGQQSYTFPFLNS